MSYPWMPVGHGDNTWTPTNLITGAYEARRYPSAAECLAACADLADAEREVQEDLRRRDAATTATIDRILGRQKAGLWEGEPDSLPCIPPSWELPVGESPAEADRKLAEVALAIAAEQPDVATPQQALAAECEVNHQHQAEIARHMNASAHLRAALSASHELLLRFYESPSLSSSRGVAEIAKLLPEIREALAIGRCEPEVCPGCLPA